MKIKLFQNRSVKFSHVLIKYTSLDTNIGISGELTEKNAKFNITGGRTMEHHEKRSTFSGKLGFVLSAAGASVGLGNIWRFPYLAAKYGGGIFLLIYIILALTFGYTMIVAETVLGRMTRKSPVGIRIHCRQVLH